MLDGNVVFGDLSESQIKPPLFTKWPQCEKEPLQARDPAEIPTRCVAEMPAVRVAVLTDGRSDPDEMTTINTTTTTTTTISGPDPGEIHADGQRHKSATTLRQVLVLEKNADTGLPPIEDAEGNKPKPKPKKKKIG